MSERRKPSLTLHVALASGEKLFADLFDAGDFPGQEGAGPGLYRMRVRTTARKSAWHCPDCKYTFLSFSQCAEALLAMASGAAPCREEEPFLPPGSLVRTPGESGVIRELCRTNTIPFPGLDGRWRVFAGLSGREPVLVRDLRVVEFAGFICRGMPPEGAPCPTKAEALARGWINDGEYPRRAVEFTAADLRGGRPRKKGGKFSGKRPEVEHVGEKPGA